MKKLPPEFKTAVRQAFAAASVYDDLQNRGPHTFNAARLSEAKVRWQAAERNFALKLLRVARSRADIFRLAECAARYAVIRDKHPYEEAFEVFGKRSDGRLIMNSLYMRARLMVQGMSGLVNAVNIEFDRAGHIVGGVVRAENNADVSERDWRQALSTLAYFARKARHAKDTPVRMLKLASDKAPPHIAHQVAARVQKKLPEFAGRDASLNRIAPFYSLKNPPDCIAHNLA